MTALLPQQNHEVVRLYLSGGSHRAALASVGAITYLATANAGIASTPYRWSEVDEVVGVSGGSQPVAALIAGLARPTIQSDDERAVESLRRFYRALVHEAPILKKGKRRRFLLALVLLATIPLIFLAFLVAVWLFPLSWIAGLIVPAWLVFVLGVVSIPIIYRVASLLLRGYLRSFIATVVPAASAGEVNGKAKLSRFTEGAGGIKRNGAHGPRRSYFIVTTGMSSGTNYAYFAGQGVPPLEKPWKYDSSDERLVDACTHSCALPPLSKRAARPPVAVPVDVAITKPLPDEEGLLDGGYGGNFGVQVVHKVVAEISDHSQTGAANSVNPHDRRIIAIDAGTKVNEETNALWLPRLVSTVVRLLRIVEVSNHATYRNDLEDLYDVDGSVVTVSRTGGSASKSALGHELKKRVELNGQLGLFNVTPNRAALAVAVGVAGIFMADMTHRGSQATKQHLANHLQVIGKELDPNEPDALVDVWKDPSLAW